MPFITLILLAACNFLEPDQQAGKPTIPQGKSFQYVADANPRHRLMVYQPAEASAEESFPIVVWIHGGGWMRGDHRRMNQMLSALIESDRYVVASIGYRLSDEALWPAQIHDCKAAIKWLKSNADVIRGDSTRIGVIGASAGGHLASMLGTSGGDRTMSGTLGVHLRVDDRVQCVVDLFGPTDLLQMDNQANTDARLKHDAPDSPESRLLGGPLQSLPELAKSANPITYVTRDDPPFLIIHGTEDDVVPHQQSVMLKESLDDAGIESTLISIAGGGHGGPKFEDIELKVLSFLDQHLHRIPQKYLGEEAPERENKSRSSAK